MKNLKGRIMGSKKNNVKNIICILCIAAFAAILFPHVYDQTLQRLSVYSPEQISQYTGYQIEGGYFEQVADDPGFILNGQFDQVGNVNLNFQEPLGADTNIQIFFAGDGEAFEEARSVSAVIPKSATSWEMSLPKDCYNALRMDVDGNFNLSDVMIYSYQKSINYLKLIIWGCFALALFLFILKNHFQISYYYDSMISKIYAKGMQMGVRIERVFIFFAIVFGTIFSILLPPGQAPDEPAHFQMLVTEFGFSAYYSEIESFYNDINADRVRQKKEKQNCNYIQKNFHKRFSCEKKQFEGISVKCIRHLPMGIGFFCGVWFGFPILVCLFLAEFCAVLFYAITGYFALKVMPFHKELLCGIMLLPMTLQQCSSVNYDAVLLPLCFLLLAMLLHYIYIKEKVQWKELFWLGMILIGIMQIKPPYIVLFFLIFLIPKEKWELKIGKRCDVASFVCKYCWWIAACGTVLIAVGIYILRESFYIKVFISMVLDIPHSIAMISDTIRVFGLTYIKTMIANFGWLDTPAPEAMYGFVLLAFVLFSQSEITVKNQKMKIAKKSRAVFLATGMLIFLLVITIMISHTFLLNEYDACAALEGIQGYLSQIQVILGVQGRYYIPIALLFFLSLQGAVSLRKEDLMMVQAVYYPVILCWSMEILLYRYYLY